MDESPQSTTAQHWNPQIFPLLCRGIYIHQLTHKTKQMPLSLMYDTTAIGKSKSWRDRATIPTRQVSHTSGHSSKAPVLWVTPRRASVGLIFTRNCWWLMPSTPDWLASPQMTSVGFHKNPRIPPTGFWGLAVCVLYGTSTFLSTNNPSAPRDHRDLHHKTKEQKWPSEASPCMDTSLSLTPGLATLGWDPTRPWTSKLSCFTRALLMSGKIPSNPSGQKEVQFVVPWAVWLPLHLSLICLMIKNISTV